MPTSAEDHQAVPSSEHQMLLLFFQKGIDEFNSGQFYACHDTLEAIWMAVDQAEKPFYQGILQIAVAFYHLGNLNWRGGAILLGEGIGRLRRFEPSYEGIDVEDLVDQAFEWLELVQAVGEDGLEGLMKQMPRALPRVNKVDSGEGDGEAGDGEAGCKD
ncbi:MAG: DUF309 domain-containing protein [Cyanobacteria bacterium J06627_28]